MLPERDRISHHAWSELVEVAAQHALERISKEHRLHGNHERWMEDRHTVRAEDSERSEADGSEGLFRTLVHDGSFMMVEAICGKSLRMFLRPGLNHGSLRQSLSPCEWCCGEARKMGDGLGTQNSLSK